MTGSPAILAPSSSLFSMSTNSNGGSLIFFPDFGGNVLYAKPIVQKLGKNMSCYGVRLAPDFIDNDKSASLVDIALRFAQEISEANLRGPIYVCGFSFAGYFAYETALWLSNSYSISANLIILDTAIRPKSLRSRLTGSPLQEIIYAISYLSKNWQHIFSEKDTMLLRKYGQIEFDLSQHPESYRIIIRQMYDMMSKYAPRRWENGSAVVLRAQHKGGVSRFGLKDLGWKQFIDGNVTIVDVPGDHLSMLRDPENANILAIKLQEIIGQPKEGADIVQFS